MKRRLQLLFVSLTIVNLAAVALTANAFAAASPTSTSDSSSSSSSASSAATAAQAKLLTTLKTKADAEITRRLTTLGKLSSVISNAPLLSTANKTALSATVTSTTSDLTALKTKIDAETTLAAAQADAQTITTDYRVYALVVPQVYLVRTSDDQLAVNAKLNTVAGKLQTRLTAAKTAGKDTTALQAKLTDMTAQIAAAKTISTNVQTAVLPLKPTDYNSDHTILSGYVTQLKTAHTDNTTAYNDAKAIVTGLAAL